MSVIPSSSCHCTASESPWGVWCRCRIVVFDLFDQVAELSDVRVFDRLVSSANTHIFQALFDFFDSCNDIRRDVCFCAGGGGFSSASVC
jgi:hypothetical protein